MMVNAVNATAASAPSEKATVLSARYGKVISQGRRNDILREIEEIGTCGHDVHKSRNRDGIGEEYGMTGRNIARYMRVDKLIKPFKDRLDAGDMTLTAAGELTEGKLEEIMHPAKKPLPARSVSIKMPAEVEEKYFSGMKAKERTDLVMRALDAWFAGKEAADVQ